MVPEPEEWGEVRVGLGPDVQGLVDVAGRTTRQWMAGGEDAKRGRLNICRDLYERHSELSALLAGLDGRRDAGADCGVDHEVAVRGLRDCWLANADYRSDIETAVDLAEPVGESFSFGPADVEFGEVLADEESSGHVAGIPERDLGDACSDEKLGHPGAERAAPPEFDRTALEVLRWLVGVATHAYPGPQVVDIEPVHLGFVGRWAVAQAALRRSSQGFVDVTAVDVARDEVEATLAVVRRVGYRDDDL